MPNPQIQSLTVNGTTYDIVDNTSGYITGMTILSYGSSTWQDFINAYSGNKVVYCRASSQANPATGDQTRLAFMAYVNNPTNPTSVEFQYYRSVSTHTATQQGDQVFVYTLTSAGNWSVTTREASVEVAVGGDLTGSYSNGTYTVSGDIPSISVSQIETSGVNIADVTIDGTTTHLYAPQGGGGGSVTSVAVSNATNGGLSVSGSPITSSGTISIGHSNVLTSAQTTQAVYPITIDKNGHISAYGGAVTITDEKLKTSALGVSTTIYYPVLTTDASAAETKKYSTLLQARYKDSNYNVFNLRIGNGVGIQGKLELSNSGASGSFTELVTSGTAAKTITLPNASGTVALTSDIPTVPTNVSAFTNDAGYLTAHQTIPVTDVKMNGSSIVSGGIAAITNASGDVTFNGTVQGNLFYMDLATSDSLYTEIDTAGWRTAVIVEE